MRSRRPETEAAAKWLRLASTAAADSLMTTDGSVHRRLLESRRQTTGMRSAAT